MDFDYVLILLPVNLLRHHGEDQHNPQILHHRW